MAVNSPPWRKHPCERRRLCWWHSWRSDALDVAFPIVCSSQLRPLHTSWCSSVRKRRNSMALVTSGGSKAGTAWSSAASSEAPTETADATLPSGRAIAQLWRSSYVTKADLKVGLYHELRRYYPPATSHQPPATSYRHQLLNRQHPIQRDAVPVLLVVGHDDSVVDAALDQLFEDPQQVVRRHAEHR